MHKTNFKPSASTRKLAKRKTRVDTQKDERSNKGQCRKRDRFCRFPLCGCRRLGWRLEASHQSHKGAGGNPTGSRSTADQLLLLCVHRHRDGAVSRHHGTLRARYLTADRADGPVAWEVDMTAVYGFTKAKSAQWREVARESAVQQLEPLDKWQEDALLHMAEMTV